MSEPTRVGKFQLVRPLGAGGMGEVFLARETGPGDFKRWVALKRVLRHLVSDRHVSEMFLHEARVAARLNHPNIVHLVELGEDDGSYYLAMEYVHGVSGRVVAQQRTAPLLPPACAVDLVMQVLEGLAYAHDLKALSGDATQVIHRDISPDNLMVTFEGVVKILDFGIAKLNSASAFTAHGAVRGKFAYMAPEQFQRQPVHPSTDLYSAGVVLYELLARRRPFVGDSDASVMHAVLHGELIPLQDANPDIAPALAEVVRRALSRDPASRFSSAPQMREALRPHLGPGGMAAAREATSAWLKAHFANELHRATEALAATSPLEGTRPLLDVPRPAPVERPPRRQYRWPGLAAGVAVSAALGWSLLRAAPAAVTAPTAQAPVPPAEALVDAGAVEPAAPVQVATSPAAPERPPRSTGEHPALQGTGTLDLQVLPWAEVTIDERRYGVTPLAPIKLPAGRHRLRLRNDELGMVKQLDVRVLPGRRLSVRHSFFESPR